MAAIINKKDASASAQFWKKTLDEVEMSRLSHLTLPYDGAPQWSRRILNHGLDLKAFNDVSKANGTSVLIILQAAWAAVLGRFLGLDTISFASTLEDGDAAKTGICAASWTPRTTSLQELIEQLQSWHAQTTPHQTSSLRQLQVDSQATVLCDTGVRVCHASSSKIALENIAQDPRILEVNAQISQDQIQISLDYNLWALSAKHIQSIAVSLEMSLRAVVRDASISVSNVDLCGDDDRKRAFLMNATIPETFNACLHTLVEQQARERPDAPAADGAGGSLTYRQLDDKANILAAHLQRLGVGPETYVPFCFDKSSMTIVAMLAILKAGGAFLALNPSHPINRLAIILSKVEAKIILTDSINSGVASELVDRTVVVTEDLLSGLARGPLAKKPVDVARPNNPAYVVFTSGTTGEPKGIVIEHSGVCSSMLHTGAVMNLDHSSRVLQFAAYTWDVGIGEIFNTLIHGGCICTPTEEERMDDFAGVIRKLDANWTSLTPTVAGMLNPDNVPSLKTLLVGGEAVKQELIETWAGKVYFINMYGPSETTIWSGGRPGVTPGTPCSNIGHGYGSLNWITNPADPNQLCPIGAVGEILIEGPGLARGYLKDEEKTSASFIYDVDWIPKGRSPRRLYRSADLGYFNLDGSLSIVGRKDTQVKLRGQRLEIGEIEFHLTNLCKNLEAGLVELIKPKAQNEQPALAAFLCFDNKLQSDTPNGSLILTLTEDLRQELAELKENLALHLPSYMVPSIFVPVARMPTTVSGKLDRRRLRNLAADFPADVLAALSLSTTNTIKRAPTTGPQKALSKIWAQLLSLQLDTIGIDDNFFQMGGDSVAAMKLAAAARMVGLGLTVSKIFKQPTLESMSRIAEVLVDNETKKIDPFSLVDIADLPAFLEEMGRKWNLDVDQIEDVYPATALQEGLMAITQAEPGSYIYQNLYELPASIDLEVFRRAWEAVVATTEILRTTIVPTDQAGTYQVVTNRSISWEYPTNVEEYVKADAEKTMQYGDPLARYALVRHEQGGATFIWTAHHALYDGWSLPLLWTRVEQTYKANGVAQPIDTPFNQFIEHLNGLESSDLDAFWKKHLASSNPPKFPQLPSVTYQPRVNSIHTSEFGITGRVSSDATDSTLIRAAWSILMSQYTDAGDDVIIGITTAGRNADVPGISEMIAPTITTVPVRVQIDREQTVTDFLNMVQADTIEMIPFEHAGLQNIAKINRECRLACSFQNLLVVQPEEDEDSASTLGIRKMQSPDVGIYTYALVVQCMLRGDKVGIQVDFDNHVLSSSQVERICRQLEHIVGQLRSNSAQKIGELSLVSEGDLNQLLDWNQTFPYVEERCIHEIVHAQVLATPDAPAICSWDGDFTYAEVDRLSNQFARHLVELGVGPETLVPHCFSKSAWTVIAMLGIAKAGGACVALDPGHPVDRLSGIIDDAGAKLVVTTPEHSSIFTGLVSDIVQLSPAWFESHDYSADKLLPRAEQHNPVFVLFTSGSTGKPKGIIIEHGMFASSAAAHGDAFGIGAGSRVLQFAAHTFDVSVGDIFTSLMRGACICIPSELERMNNVAGAINRMNVNYAFLTPTVANLLIPEQVPTLRRLTLGGEAPTKENIRTWADNLDLILCYGPAECSVYCSANPPATQKSNPAVLGRAIGALIWLVDPVNHNKLAPVGCVGELVVQGPTVARGYLNEPEKTQSSFIQDPEWIPSTFADRFRRIYKTGDLARFNNDGTLSFVARKDTQAKVRGQRVELAEIEVHLSESPEIQHAMVSVPAAGLYKSRLVCVLSFQEFAQRTGGSQDNDITLVDGAQRAPAGEMTTIIENRLTEKLPPYMVPAVWIPLKKIPLNGSGKIDRKLLKGWLEDVDDATYQSIAGMAGVEANAQPLNDMEKKICDAFSETLNLSAETIGPSTSFLSIGGDSISAMQVMSRLRTQNIRVTVQDVLKLRTVAALGSRAQYIEQSMTTGPAHEPEILDEWFDLAPIQQLFFQMQPQGQNHFNQSFVLKLGRELSQGALRKALESVVQRHSMLRSRFSQVDGLWRQKITNDVAGSLLLLPSKTMSRAEMISNFQNIQTMMDVASGPVLAAQLCTADNTEYIFLAAHHLVIDLVSWRIILQDLQDVIEDGKFKSEQTVSFQLWSKLQQEYAAQNLSDNDVADINAPVVDLGYWGMEGKSNTWGDVTEASFTLDKKRTSLLLGQSNDALRTEPTEIMVAALLHSFRQAFPERHAPAVYLEGHGREPWTASLDVSQTVGWFTTMYPISYETTEYSWLDALRRIKDNRRKVSDNGWRHFTARSFSAVASQDSEFKAMELLFNYSGLYQQFQKADALFQEAGIAPTECGEISPNMQRYSLFDIASGVVNGEMEFKLEYNKKMGHQDAIKSWMHEYRRTLEDGLDELMKGTEMATLSDFPLLSLTYAGLDSLMQSTLPSVGVQSLEEVETLSPCSPMQLGLLMSQLKSAGDYEFFTILKASAREGVNSQKLFSAWQQVVDRHPMLRTVFVKSAVSDGLYDQLVFKAMEARTVEIHSSDPVEALKALEPVGMVEGKAPHQLAVCHDDDGQLFCKLEVNHALIDGTSMAIIVRDLKRAYGDQLSKVEPLHYSDYVTFLQDSKKEESLDFWKEYLEGVQPCQFPALNDGHEQVQSLESIDVEIPGLTKEALSAFSDRFGITLANVVQTAWALVLRTFIGTDSVCYGYLTSGRDAPLDGIEDAVGPFINMLVCRLDFDANEPALLALQNMQEGFLKGMSHQYVSLAEMQHSLGITAQGLFNTAMSFQRYSPDEDSDLNLKTVYDYDPTEFNITVNVATSESGVKIDLTYWTSKLSTGQAVHIANTYSAAIQSLLQNPETLLSDVNLLSPLDKQTMQQWNKQIPSAIDRCMHSVIHQNAQERPDALALESWEAKYTYQQLDQASTRLARHLLNWGIQPDDCIPLCFEKSLYTIVALVAVLKAGGGFVLLDPKHPDDRLKGLLDDINARFVIVSPQTLDRCKSIHEELIVVSPEVLEKLPSDDSDLVTSVTPQNIMYVQFTSGSTGKPKGAVVHHKAACSSIEHHGKVMRYGPNARVFQFSSYTFDAIILEAFTTLYHGGCVCIPSEEDRMSSMVQSMREMEINLMFMTPTLARLFQPEDVPSLETLMLGGEPIPQDSERTWKDKVNLIGGYGPAECCVYCCYNPLSESGLRTDVIGYPVGSLLWLVEPENHDNLVPIGAIGEIVVHGHIVGRGYLNDPAKTAASYIESPSWMSEYHTGEQRLYKTGDLGRYNSDGTLTIVGRKDTQVKLNGQRIELGEIEHHIKTEYAQVFQVAVDALKPEHANGRQVLSAFLEFEDSETVETSEMLLPMTDSLREVMFEIEATLTQLLPPYMVPHLWLPLSSMPKSASGKTDRKVLKQLCNALPESRLQQYSLATGSKKPVETEMERKIEALWAGIFTASEFGSNDNFFRLGGDSVEAMKLAAAARRQGLSLTVADIFLHPKLSDMALATVSIDGEAPTQKYEGEFSLVGGLENARAIVQEHLVGIDFAAVEDIYPSTSLQEGLLALTSVQSDAYVYQAVYKLPGDLDLARFRTAWASTVESNPILRTVMVSTESNGTCQVVLKTGIQWETASTLGQYLEQNKETAMTYGSPLSRYGLTLDRHFVWTAHHSLYDGWSFALMLEEVEKKYNDSSASISRPLFAEYIQFLQQQSKPDAVGFWKSQLENASPTVFPQLPNSLYEPQVDQAFSLKLHDVTITGRAGVTPSTLLTAAWGLTVAQLANTEDIVFGTTRSGRNVNLNQITEMMGPTIATVPVRMTIDDNMSMEELLQNMQGQATSAIPYEHLGLQNIGKIDADCKAACGFQNLFVVQPTLVDKTALGMEQIELATKGLHTYALNAECILEEDGTGTVHFEFDSNVIQGHRVRWFAEQFQQVLRQLCTGSGDLKVSDIDLFSPEDEKRVVKWNSTLYPEVSRCAHDIITELAKLHPNQQAVVQSNGTSFTYGEVDELSDLFAHHLSTLGVVPGQIVPICLKRSVWVVIAMLAVLKNGAAFVCLDPSSPMSRMEVILEDVEADLIVTGPETTKLFTRNADLSMELQVAEIGAGVLTQLGVPISQFEAKGSPKDLMYLIFTSGSTGKPKGVMIEHASACSTFIYQGREFGFDRSIRTLQFSSLTFDASLMEIFTTMCAGGCVCFPTEEEKQGDLVRAMNNLEVHCVMMTPTMLRMIQPEDVPQLKTVVTGGEAVGRDTVQAWSSRVALKGVYGPTECSMTCVMTDLVPGCSPANIGVPVGCRAWITVPDDHNRLAPVGSIGELLIQGPIVGRGYYRSPEKTDEVFIDTPTWLHERIGESARLYKTGDLVHYAEDGTLIIVGRKDTQVKLHGQRIELGEIEHHMWSHPAVKNASVVLPRSGHLKERLVAVLTMESIEDQLAAPKDLQPLTGDLRQSTDIEIASIRQTLREKLPLYMVPTVFVAVEKMPTQTSGKTDVKRVKQWVDNVDEQTVRLVLDVEIVSGSVIPSNETEREIQTVVSQVLGISQDKIVLSRSFLSFGGDSISAMKVASQLRKTGIRVTLKDILRSGSISDLAAMAASKQEASSQDVTESSTPPVPAPEGPASKTYPLLRMNDKELEVMLQKRLPGARVSDLDRVEDIYPCSPLQEGLLLAQTKGVGSYNVFNVYEIQPREDGDAIDPLRLAEAWKAVVRRHQVLRTIFIQGLDETSAFSQVVLREVPTEPTIVEGVVGNAKEYLQSLPPTQYRAMEPWHTLTICSDKMGKVCCGIQMHHTLFDANSMDIILHEAGLLYNSDTISQTAPLYRDYIAYLQDRPADDAISYWKTYLKGLEPCYFPSINEEAMGLRKPQSLHFSFQGVRKLQAFASRKGLTVSSVLQTAWALVLRHYTGSEDVCFGYLSHGRDIPVEGVESIVGPMINMLVLRAVLKEDGLLSDALNGTRDDVLNSLSYQHCSLAEIHHALDLHGRAAFNTTLSFASGALQEEEKDAITFQNLAGGGSTEYDIAVNASIAGEELQVMFSYWSSALSSQQAKAVAQSFTNFIDLLIRSPDSPMREVSLSSNAMVQQLRRWNSTPLKPVNDTVHELFHRAALAHPQNQAISSVDGDFTYAKLDDVTTRFARFLRQQGVGPEVLVPVCFKKSAWTIVSMISIMKAGGACVPLDPSHPPARLQEVISRCDSSLILAAPQYVDLLSDKVAEVIPVTEEFVQSLPKSTKAMSSISQANNAAFVVFTSGSTGLPKGIILEHTGLCTMFLANAPVVGIDATTRTFQYAAYTFDVSIAETYITLTHGGCVCVPTEAERMNDIPGSISRMKANWTFLTPSVASLLKPTDVPSLKTLTLGGEAISRDLHSTWADRVRLINSYGPAECSIWTSNQRLFPESSCSDIGAGVTCYLWVTEPENHDRLVPIGCVGELVVQGPNLARGYLKDQEKTDAAYIDVPAWLRHDSTGLPKRVYKTGDLVRHAPDGRLEFVGRKDTQIKFHGQRIEIGEVEYQIRARLPLNTQVVVEMIKPLSQNGRQTLAGFISTEDADKPLSLEGSTDTASSMLRDPDTDFKTMIRNLEQSLSETLPAYMIPSIFIDMMRIPKNTSMKVDRKALRTLGADLSLEQLARYSLDGGEKRAPQTAMEKTLHELWTTVLKLSPESIGADDSFFRIGGDSIGAMQLVAAARKIGLSLSVADIFQNQKLHEMANVIESTAATDLSADLLVEPFSLLPKFDAGDFTDLVANKAGFKPNLIQDAYPSTSLQEGLMSLTSRDHGLYMLQAVYRLPDTIVIQDFQLAWQSVVEELDILRTRLIDLGHLGSFQVVLRAAISQMHWNYNEDLKTYLQQDHEVPFGYGKPLARYAIVQEEAATFFVWTAHHAVYDGWSLGLMMDLVEQKYMKKNTLPSPPFNRFLHWLTNLDKAATRQYWKSTFEGYSAPQFPPTPQGYRTRAKKIMSHSINLPEWTNSEVTIPTVIRTAWALNISQYTRSNDVVFGMTQTGRNAPVPGTTEMVAPLITTVPVRVKFDDSQSVSSLLEDVQKQMIAMIPHEHVGLQNIGKLSPECQAACKFENLLLVQSRKDESVSPLGLERIPVMDLDIPAFGIVAECEIADGQVTATVGYDPNVVSESDMQSILYQFDHMVQQIGEDGSGSKALGSLQLLGEHEIQQQQAWNQLPDDRVDRCAHDMIHERALIQPDALAIESAQAQLTYGQLDDLSTRLAHFLKNLGAGPDTVIPLFFRRSPWAVVSMLAVMKSGSGFVFLDPQHPVDRLEFVLEQINARLIITTPDLAPTWESKLAVLSMTPSFLSNLKSYDNPPETAVTPRNILYVIFTSGSTGRPKGCVIEHSSFLSGAVHHAQCSRISPSTRVLQMAPYTFDVSILETLTGLLSGACICLPSDKHQGLPVSTIIQDLKVSWVFLTPSVARTITPSDVPSLKTLILGGESLSKVDIQTWAGRLHLINGYGPSECSVAAAANQVASTAVDPANIGTAMGCNCWVVDAENHDILLPVGAVGELLVEGAIVGRGYLNEPEKTDAAFITNPLWLNLMQSSSQPRRFYKTGDLVKLNEDGSIHFIGRKDTQFKLRGQRIELGEIEHHGSTYVSVKLGLVAVPRAGRMKDSLVMVFSPKDLPSSTEGSDLIPISSSDLDSSVSLASLRDHLVAHLPPYMVPKTLIAVNNLPLLASGKINRSKVQGWLEGMDDATHELVAEQTGKLASHAASPIDEADTVAIAVCEGATQLLAGDDEAYMEVLKGRNFLLSEAGLNSISVVSLSAFIRDRFDVKISIDRLMDSSVTIEHIARMIEKAGAEDEPQSELDLLAEADKMMQLLETEALPGVETLNAPTDRAERVLLTGATGFLGSEILRQLLVNPQIRSVVAIVRASDEQHAMDKVISSATAAKWWQDEYKDRVEVWVGDLAEPKLGLADSHWADIEGRSEADRPIDAIVHNGAMVHWGADYNRLRPVNVDSVVSLLASLTRSAAPPQFTFVSGGHVPLEETSDEQMAQILANSTGYGQSKFVADLVVKRFAEKYSTSAASIVKPGLIIGTTDAGVSNTDDFFWRVVSSAVEIGAFNADEPEGIILLAGAQQVASMVLDASLVLGSPQELPVEQKVPHFVTTRELWTMLSEQFGYTLTPMSAASWVESLKADVQAKGDSHRLWPVLHFLEAGAGYLGQPAASPVISDSGVDRVEVLASLRKSIEYMRAIGYFHSDQSLSSETVFGRTRS